MDHTYDARRRGDCVDVVEGSCGIPTIPGEPETGNYFVSTYPPFSTWEAEHAAWYREALARPCDDKSGFGLYVHIPYCINRCMFCYYLSYKKKNDGEVQDFYEGLLRELTLLGASPAVADRPLDFAYFGGGTPSILSAGHIARLLQQCHTHFTAMDCREITFECSPMTVTRGKVKAMQDGGVTRLSMGVQHLDDEVLRQNGRKHLTADVLRAYNAIRNQDFPVVNLDLISGLVGETDETFDRSLEKIIALQPDSVTIYNLEIPQNTPLFGVVRKQVLGDKLPNWTAKRARLARGFDRLTDAGYTRISAYTAVRNPQRHGFLYQDAQYRGADLIGAGPASFSYLQGINHQNLASNKSYLEALRQGRLPFGRGCRLAAGERMVREFVLQLKLGAVERSYFLEKFGSDVGAVFAVALREHQDSGYLLVDDERISLTDSGFLCVDRILPTFYMPHHRDVRYS